MERAPLIVLLVCGWAVAQTTSERSLEDAVALMRSGDLAGAEQLLKARASDADALGLLAVVLDQEKKFPDADEVYRRALKMAPRSPALLNNYGNHLLATGKGGEARALFLRVIAANPEHVNARVQLARIALEQREPRQALAYIERVPSSALQAPDVAVLRMQVMYAVHRDAEGDALLGKITEGSYEDAGLARALASVGKFEKARGYYARALQAQPENVDLLYEAATGEASLEAPEKALALLARAAKMAPERADVQQLLARMAGRLGLAGDAAQAWTRYTVLVPGDDEGRRERGFAQTALGGDTTTAISDLRWFTRRHPEDPAGHYELGTAIAPSDPAEARAELDSALALRPDLIAAHVARGILSYREGNFAGASVDFRFAAEHDPKNAAVLDRVGETYLALEQPQRAVRWLREAAVLAPSESRILLHLGRALSGAGQTDEAANVLARFRELGADTSTLPRAAGVVDFLSLPPSEQMTRYRAGVEKTVGDHPENAEAQVRYLSLLLDRGDPQQAEAVSRTIVALKPSRALLVQAADALVAAGQFRIAKQFIQAANEELPLTLDLSLAVFYLDGAQAALPIVEDVPVAARSGDYFLVRTMVLLGAGRMIEARESMEKALAGNSDRPELYRFTARVLIDRGDDGDARKLMDRAVKRFPDSPELLELQAEAHKKAK